MNYLRRLSVMVFLIVGSCMSATAASGVQQTQSASQPAKAWTIEDVMAALEWRRSALADCSLSYTEEVALVYQPGDTKDLWKDEVDFCQRSEAIAFRHTKRYLTPETKQQVDISQVAWDGKLARSIYTMSQRGVVLERPRGEVAERMPLLLEDNSQCLKMLDLSPKTPMAMRLKRIVEHAKAAPVIDATETGGETTVSLAVKDQYGADWEFVFLPDKDFLIRRFARKAYVSATSDVLSNEFVFETTETKQVDGLWIPATIVERNLSYDHGKPSPVNLYTMQVSGFRLGKPTDEQMTVVFPPGMRVIDAAAMQAYEILPDGTRKYEPLMDGRTGQMVKPPSTQPAREGSVAK